MASENVYLFQRHEMAASLFSVIVNLKENDVLCDVTIHVGSRSFQAHRIILAAGIPYFRAMFSSNMVECIQKEITLQDVDPLAMENLINFVYTHELKITLENVELLLKASLYLQLDLVVDVCFDFLRERIDSSTVLVVHSCAILANRVDMIENADRYITDNFEAFSLSNEFCSLSFTLLKDIICKDSLFVMKEEVVFEAVMKWVKSSEVDRLPHLPELLSHIRMPLINEEYLNTYVCSELIQALPACRDIISETKKYHTSPEGEMTSFGFKTEERFCEAKNHLKCAKLQGYGLYVISKGPSSVFVNYYDSSSKKLLNLGSPLDINLVFLKFVACTEDRIYFLNYKYMQVLNLKTLQLTLLEHNHLPDQCGAVFHQHKLYFFGGTSLGKWNEVHSFDLQNGTLVKKGYMLNPFRQQLYPSAASMGDFIYITGGFSGFSGQRYAEKYNSVTEKSSKIAKMVIKRFGHGCAALNGKIYVCGGNSHNMTVSGEVYDPFCDQWSLLNSMTTISCSLCLLSYGNELTTIDNRVWSEDGLLVKTYSPSDDKWQFGIPCSLPSENCEFLSAVVTNSVSPVIPKMSHLWTGMLIEDRSTPDSSWDTDSDDTD